jgi:hypothetical protein
MTFASINAAANDQQLRARVDAAAQKEARMNPAFGNTAYGQQLIAANPGMGGAMPSGVTMLPSPLMWGVAVDTEAAYFAALQAGRGAPGHDNDIITDGMITAAVQAHWPPDPVTPTGLAMSMPTAMPAAMPMTSVPPPLSPEEEMLRQQPPPDNGHEHDEPAS